VTTDSDVIKSCLEGGLVLCSGISKASLSRYTGTVNPFNSFHGLPSTELLSTQWISPSLILTLSPYGIKCGKRVLTDSKCLSIKVVKMETLIYLSGTQ